MNEYIRIWKNPKTHYVIIVYDIYGLGTRYKADSNWKEIQHFDEHV